MSRTPEGKIKDAVRAILAEFEASPHDVDGFHVGHLYQHWPVPSGFGASTLDCLVGYCGMFIAIETKAPGKKPTPRQKLTCAEIKGAKCKVFVIDGAEGLLALRTFLLQLKFRNADADAHDCK